MKRTPLLTTCFAALATVLAFQAASAQSCAKATRIVVPYPAGAPDDAIARILAAKLSETGERFYVENIPGATGAIGTVAVARAANDGCTLLVVNQNFVIQPAINPKTMFDVRVGFAAVSLLASAPETITVGPSLPVRSLRELVSLLKANPGKYSYASPGYGSSPHLAAERLFRVTLGLDVVHVPFQGGPPAINSVLGGHTQIVPLTAAIVAPFVSEGKLRMLAIADKRRFAAFPEVPTLEEVGYPGLEIGYWNGIVVPNGTPEHVIGALNERIRGALSSPEVARRLQEIGFEPNPTPPEAFAKHIESESARWGAIAQQAQIKIE